MARSVNATPNTANAAPRANLALGDNCAAAAATAVKTRPDPASAAPKASDPPAGMSVLSSPAAPIAPVAIEAPKDSSSAALRLAYRPTAVESTNSVLPASSSARVCRITVRMTATAMSKWNIPAFQMPTAPMLSLWTCP